MRIFISGGCKNGKSTCAQHLAKRQSKPSLPLYYIATMKAVDSEDNERITRHQRERDGLGFITIEQPKNIEGILTTCNRGGSFLLDSLTALLFNEFDGGACERAAAGLTRVLLSISDIVIVSDYIYSDAFLYDAYTEGFRKSLATLDRLAATHCDVVLEAAYTQIITHKGGGLIDEIS
jgi:adenosylcobinamide kinase/adenosylcobinamide-phosphate guanylyltransferase